MFPSRSMTNFAVQQKWGCQLDSVHQIASHCCWTQRFVIYDKFTLSMATKEIYLARQWPPPRQLRKKTNVFPSFATQLFNECAKKTQFQIVPLCDIANYGHYYPPRLLTNPLVRFGFFPWRSTCAHLIWCPSKCRWCNKASVLAGD